MRYKRQWPQYMYTQTHAKHDEIGACQVGTSQCVRKTI